MKLLFTLLLAFASAISLYPQHSLQNKYNLPRPGDEIIKQQVDYKNPGRSGENVLWDFGKLNIQNNEYSLVYSSRETA